ncbi:MAG: TIGR04190 family B12-binding domain/radical SAM domain protein [candidate division KSB1 bacterium]|nr:TIGR04190 family B12-binding domain/radical SAM domain protein [candidate division KSB1 bacterium]
MIFRPDLILLHAPSVYDFRKIPNLFGPISDVVPSTPVFEMYPVGFSSIAEYLERNGVGVQIINLAYRMLTDADYDVEKRISKLRPKAFGIDLHWLVHAQGSIEIAKLCKKYHPDIPVIFGGLSSTYYHEQLIQYPEIDYVFRGDTTEIPLLTLMKRILAGDETRSNIPNLSWKDANEETRVNPHSYTLKELNSFSNNYKNLFKIAVKYGDIKSMTAIYDWWSYPITAVMTCKGCTHNCVICGGSHKGLKYYAHRNKPAYRSPELIVEDIKDISRFTTSPVFIVGDLNQPPNDYGDKVISGIKKLNMKNHLVVELFTPCDPSFFRKLSDAVPNFNVEISPESHDEEVRRASGKTYSNADMESTIAAALENGCQKFDIFFMIGVPKQTTASVMETIDYCDHLLNKFGKKVVPFIAPLAPFLDPGSIAYENPEEFGYDILYTSFEEHRTAMLNPSWKYFLNYQTKWMTRDQIVDVTYDAGKRLNEIKLAHGLIGESDYKIVSDKIDYARNLIERIDDIIRKFEGVEREQALKSLQLDLQKDSISTVCEENEIKWPVLKSGFKFFQIAKAIVFE